MSQQIKLDRYSSTAELTDAVIDGRLEWMKGMWELHNEDTEAPAWLLALCVFYIDAHEAARELRAENARLRDANYELLSLRHGSNALGCSKVVPQEAE